MASGPPSRIVLIAAGALTQLVGAACLVLALASLPAGRTPTRADWSRLSRGWRQRLDDQIAALAALRDGLDSCIGCGCLSLQRCAISNPGDGARASGPGAAYLPAGLRRDDGRLAGPPGGG